MKRRWCRVSWHAQTAPPDPECASPLHRDRDFGGKIRKKMGERWKKAKGDSDRPAGERSDPLLSDLIILWVFSPLQYESNEKEVKFWISLIQTKPYKMKGKTVWWLEERRPDSHTSGSHFPGEPAAAKGVGRWNPLWCWECKWQLLMNKTLVCVLPVMCGENSCVHIGTCIIQGWFPGQTEHRLLHWLWFSLRSAYPQKIQSTQPRKVQ